MRKTLAYLLNKVLSMNSIQKTPCWESRAKHKVGYVGLGPKTTVGGRGQKVSSPGLLCYQGLCYNFAGIVPMGTHPVCAILKYAKIPQKIMQNTPSAIIGMEIALNCGGNMRATRTGIPKRHGKFFWSSQLRIGWGKNTYDSVAHSYIQLMFSYTVYTHYTV